MLNTINGFLKSLESDGKSKCTIEAYSGDLKQFQTAMDGNKLLEDIKYPDLRVWVDGLAAAGLSASTRTRKISAIKSFFRYCAKMELITTNPAECLECPRIERKEPKTIAPADASNVLQAAHESHKGNVVWFRNYTILSVFLYTGIRREELTNIKIKDVNLLQRSILIHGKGSKQRYVYINDNLLAVLSEYLDGHRCHFKTAAESPFLFPSTMAEKMSVKAVNNVVNKAFEAAGIKENGVSAHILRKRFATSVFQSTADIARTSKMLGHSSPAVTMRYVVIDEDAMRLAANNVKF